MACRKEAHHRYNRSEKGKARDARRKAKRRELGVCVTCSRPLVEGLCPVCIEGGTQRKQLSREMLRGTD